MKHFFEHLFGWCGENHLNINHIILLLILFITYEVYTLGRNIQKSKKNKR